MRALYIVSSFKHSIYLELAISDLVQNGIEKENIFAIPLDQKVPTTKTINYVLGRESTNLDGAFVMGVILAVILASIGFNLRWGPIVWGLIGTGIGMIIGYIVQKIFMRKNQKQKREKQSEVFLLIRCPKDSLNLVEEVLWNHYAIGIGKVDQQSEQE